MQALVLRENGYRVEEMPAPTAERGRVVLRVEAVGICATDVPILNRQRQVPLPFIPGHECAGVIVARGRGVEGWPLGSRVAASAIRSCGTCAHCRAGDEALCDHLLETGIHVNGAFAEYVELPTRSLHLLPDAMSFEAGASVDPLACAYRAVRLAQVSIRDTVAVIGSGPIGIYALQCARVAGARRVFLLGRGAARLELAAQFAPDALIDVNQAEPSEAMRELTGGRMADVVIEAAGTTSAITAAVECATRGGRLAMLGLFKDPCPVDLRALVRKELRLQPSFRYDWRDFAHALDLLHSGVIRYQPLITDRFPLSKFDEAFARFTSRAAMKVLLQPGG